MALFRFFGWPYTGKIFVPFWQCGFFLIVLSFVNCTPKKLKSNLDAFEIMRGTKISRVYAAYDPKRPEYLTWYECEDEPKDTDTAISVQRDGTLPLATLLAQAYKSQQPLERPRDQTSDQGSKILGSSEKIQNIRLDERLTNEEFLNATNGKCKPKISNVVAEKIETEVQIQTSNQKSDPDLGKKIISAAFSCGGFTITSFVLGASVADSIKARGVLADFKQRGFLGFGTDQITKKNVGAKIFATLAGFVGCGFASQDYFTKAANKLDLSDLNLKNFYTYTSEAIKLADALLTPELWESKFSTEQVQRLLALKNSVEAQKQKITAAKLASSSSSAAFNSASLAADQTVAAIYSPIFVSTWNSMMKFTVHEKEPNAFQTNMAAVSEGLNQFLKKISEETK